MTTTAPTFDKIGRCLPSADRTYKGRFNALQKIYKASFSKISEAANAALAQTKAYPDKVLKVVGWNKQDETKATTNGQEAAKVEKFYRKVRQCQKACVDLMGLVSQELQFNKLQPLPTYEGNSSDQTERSNEQKEMQKMLDALTKVKNLFEVSVPKLRDQTNNYIHVLKEGVQLSSWQAGIISSTDYYNLDVDLPTTASSGQNAKEEEKNDPSSHTIPGVSYAAVATASFQSPTTEA